jgi:hypothetical protein
MSVKNIPAVGEQFAGYVPGRRSIHHVTYGPDTTADVVISDCGTYELFNVDAPLVAFTAWSMIETAFTASVTVDLGDTGDIDRYHANGTTASTTAGTVFVASTLAVPFNDTAGIDINATVAGAVPAAGLGHLWVEYAVLDD